MKPNHAGKRPVLIDWFELSPAASSVPATPPVTVVPDASSKSWNVA